LGEGGRLLPFLFLFFEEKKDRREPFFWNSAALLRQGEGKKGKNLNKS
jgi:hypothetical protein